MSEYSHRHADCNYPNRKVLHPIDSIPRVPDGLLDEVNAEDEDEGADNANR